MTDFTAIDAAYLQLGNAISAAKAGTPIPIPTPTPTPTPTPVPGWPPACATKTLTIDWRAGSRRYYPDDYGYFEGSDILVIRFTTGSILIPAASARISGAEYGSSPSARLWTLSSIPCDFTATGKARLAYNLNGTTSVNLWFAVGETEKIIDSYYPQLQMNKTYYLNIKNKDSAGGNMYFDFSKPAGT